MSSPLSASDSARPQSSYKRDELDLLHLSNSDLALDKIKAVCLKLLYKACERQDVVCPDGDETIISYDGAIKAISWTPFEKRVLNEPPPTNALDATFRACLMVLNWTTEKRGMWYAYGQGITSHLVFSRYAITASYMKLRGKGPEAISEISKAIWGLPTIDFVVEREEWANAPSRMLLPWALY